MTAGKHCAGLSGRSLWAAFPASYTVAISYIQLCLEVSIAQEMISIGQKLGCERIRAIDRFIESAANAMEE